MGAGALELNAQRLAPVLLDCNAAEPWPHFFEYRLSEWDVILKEAGGYMQPGLWLDVGSGNSATTALLTSRSDGYRAVGIDLPAQSWATHSYGTELHRVLWERAACQPPFAWASAGALPFRSSVFDGVFSSYSLQYVPPDASRGFRELYRVLKAGGVAVLVLPTLGERVAAMSAMWRQLLIMSARAALGRALRLSPTAPVTQAASPRAEGAHPSAWRRFRRNFPRFPLPTGDAPFRSFWQEVRDYRPAAWQSHARAAGFSVCHVATTSFTVRAVSQWLVDPWRLHHAARPLLLRVQRSVLVRRGLSHVGESVLLVLKK